MLAANDNFSPFIGINVYADLSAVTAISISDFREAVRRQRLFHSSYSYKDVY